jgi:hypothetical protein
MSGWAALASNCLWAWVMQLQPPPDHCGGSGLAGVHQSGPALPGAVHADAQIEVAGRLPGECLAGQLPQASS